MEDFQGEDQIHHYPQIHQQTQVPNAGIYVLLLFDLQLQVFRSSLSDYQGILHLNLNTEP